MLNFTFGPKTPTGQVRKLLAAARCEGDIYIIGRIVAILRYRGCTDVTLNSSESRKLLRALQSVRAGKKVLARWLPIGYQTVRLIWLARLVTCRSVKVTKRDLDRIKRAANHYRKSDDPFAKRQLRSLIETAQAIGIEL